LPQTYLHSLQPAHGSITPDYLGPQDLPWLRALLEAFARFEGRPRRELDHHLREPLPCPSPQPKREAAVRVLHGLCRDDTAARVRPSVLRASLFGAAAGVASEDKSRIRREVAADFALTAEELDAALFADLPPERRMRAPPASLSPHGLAARTNLHLAQGLLRRAAEVVIELKGNARAVVRVARLQGLIVVAHAPPPRSDYDVRLAISGPLALFRRTIVYGRALASLLTCLSWCERFRLTARCIGGARPFDVELQTGDPIHPGDEPRRFDSRLEQRFARDFAKAAPDWDIIREPEPLAIGDRLIFPDFALVHRRDRRRWLLEIVGFWTPQYLDHKLDLLRQVRLDNLIVCIDRERNCAAEELPARARVIHYRKAIRPADVLAIIDPSAQAPEPQAVAPSARRATPQRSVRRDRGALS
jgi:uncharacterized protein